MNINFVGEIGFYSDPAIQGDTIVFVCDHGIWEARTAGGLASRRTPRIGSIAAPLLDDQGERLVFSASEQGPLQIWVSQPGERAGRQLTYFPEPCRGLGWARDGRVVVCSSAHNPFRQLMTGWLVDVDTGRLERMATDPLLYFSRAGAVVVISPPGVNPRNWRGYRGGAKGEIWIDLTGTGAFRRIAPVAGNLSSPVVCRGRIYFVTDENGHPNLFSCSFEGDDLQQHSYHESYAVHSLATDGNRVVYCCGADLFLFDGQGASRKIELELAEPVQGRRKRVWPVCKLLANIKGAPDGHTVACCAMGAVFEWRLRRSAAKRLDLSEYCSWVGYLPGGRLLAVASGTEDDQLLVVEQSRTQTRRIMPTMSVGRVMAVASARAGHRVVLSNHRFELLAVDLETGDTTVLGRSKYRVIDQLEVSADGALAVCALPVGLQRTVVYLVRCDGGEIVSQTQPRFADYSPCFLPDGSVAYLSVQRNLSPGNEMITTVNVLSAPYQPVGLHSRRVHAPLAYFPRAVLFGEGIALLKASSGTPAIELVSRPHDPLRLWAVSADDIENVGPTHFLLQAGCAFYLGHHTNGRPIVGRTEAALGSLKARFDAPALWKAAVTQAWRTARDEVPKDALEPHWVTVQDLYARLVDRACTSKDVVAIQNEMLGHLRLSHAYVVQPSQQASQAQGALGVDVRFDDASRAWHITSIPCIDTQTPVALGLADPALGARVGDWLAAIDGVRLTAVHSPQAMLQNKAGHQIRCELIGPDSQCRELKFQALASDRALRSAAWVHEREEFVARATEGRAGYLHIPDVTAETKAQVVSWVSCHEDMLGLIVDLRFNEGGALGGEIAEFLARPVIARVRTRCSSARALPVGSGIRPIVVLTNRFTTSGGELLAETLRLIASARIIGEQTFGGALGHTNPRRLPDGSNLLLPEIQVVTPKEWVEVENRGTLPDVAGPWGTETPDPVLLLAICELRAQATAEGNRTILPISC